MAWRYEIRGLEDRLLERRSGFARESEARASGRRAKRMIDCICYPNLERLSLTISRSDDCSESDRLAEMPAPAGGSPGPQTTASRAAQLRYPWQQAILDAFLEPKPENLPRKINIAERVISGRLLDLTPFDLEERLALGEALLALRRLLTDQSGCKEKSARRKDIA